MKIIEFNLHLLCNSVHYMTWHWQVKNADFELKKHTHTLALALWGVFSEYFGDTKYNLTKIYMWIYACVFFLGNPTRKDLYANLSLVQMSSAGRLSRESHHVVAVSSVAQQQVVSELPETAAYRRRATRVLRQLHASETRQRVSNEYQRLSVWL